jgi:hypothetical protein
VTKEQQHPATHETGRSGLPPEKRKQDDSRKDERDADSVQRLVPTRMMFVVVLAHVVR